MRLTHKPLSEKQSELLLSLMVNGEKIDEGDIPEDKLPIACQIVKKRIDVMNLPIKFTNTALLAISSFVEIPGEAVLFLIDVLNKFENEIVTLNMINMELYPYGFYDQSSFEWLVDNKIKTHEMKWSEIY